MNALPASIYVHHCVSGATGQKRAMNPLELEFRRLCVTMWMLGNKLGSSPRATSAITETCFLFINQVFRSFIRPFFRPFFLSFCLFFNFRTGLGAQLGDTTYAISVVRLWFQPSSPHHKN